MKGRIVVDKNNFFREATLRICGNLEIDKALRSCLIYIRDYIPCDFMGFIVYLPHEECFESIAFAHQKGSDTLSIKIPVEKAYRQYLKKNFSQPRITTDSAPDMDSLAKQMILQLGWPNGSTIMMEMVLSGKRMGAVVLICSKPVKFEKNHVSLLKLLNEPFGIALTNSLRYRKVQKLKNILLEDKAFLQSELFQIRGQKIIGSDYGLKGVMEAVSQVAPLNSPVLLLGETGVGKELIAKAIHNMSPRHAGPFVKINCGAITETLIDSELFGHEKGAFTGAVSRKRGRFELAVSGTIFLDEIGELPLDAQVRLLRVLQDHEVERVGGEKTIKIDCRVIAATHRNIEEMIAEDRFREDLYYRINVFPIEIPPLRNRKGDIPSLVQHFMQKKAHEIALPGIPTIEPESLKSLLCYDWPGNVRELENIIERALIICRQSPLIFKGFNNKGNTPDFDTEIDIANQFQDLNQLISNQIKKTLMHTKGRIEGPDGASKLLNMHPATLRQKMRKLGIPFGRKAKGIYNCNQ
jgi:transcriptional regulator with GAF, ATPase, and Fis domain